MHVYRYQYRKKKKISAFPLLVVIVLTAILLFFQGRGELFLKLKEEVGIVCYEELLRLYMPGMVYGIEEDEEKTVLEQLLAYLFPLGEEGMAVTEYPTQVESELSYEMILAREAADENYVDEETGELVLTDGVPAASEGASADENGAEDSAGGTGSAAGTGLASGTGPAAETENGEAAETAAFGGTAKQVTYSREKLNDFDYLIQNFYQVDNTTTINSSQLNAAVLLGEDMSLSHDASTPQILIYHTHSQEGYADSIAGDSSTTVVGGRGISGKNFDRTVRI